MDCMATRICRRCNEELDLETGFFNSTMSKGGKNTICKQCVYKRRLGNPRYYKVFTCGGCGIEYQRNGRAGSFSLCPDCVTKGKVCTRCKQFKPFEKFHTGLIRYCRDGCDQAATRERRYGLAPGTAEVVFAQFPEECGICGATKSAGAQTSLVVDHCHATGAIRGFLCRQCNLAIGLLKDDPELVASALKYLEQTRQLSFDETA